MRWQRRNKRQPRGEEGEQLVFELEGSSGVEHHGCQGALVVEQRTLPEVFHCDTPVRQGANGERGSRDALRQKRAGMGQLAGPSSIIRERSLCARASGLTTVDDSGPAGLERQW